MSGLYIEVTIAIFKPSEKVPLTVEMLSKYFKVSHNSQNIFYDIKSHPIMTWTFNLNEKIDNGDLLIVKG